MATPAQVKAAIASKVVTLLSGQAGARMASDLSLDRQAIPAGDARFQLRALVGPPTKLKDSNTSFAAAMAVELRVHYHLGSSEAEQTYTDGDMQTWLAALSDPTWWTSISGVEAQLDELPEAALSDIRRVGSVVSFAVTLVLTVNVEA